MLCDRLRCLEEVTDNLDKPKSWNNTGIMKHSRYLLLTFFLKFAGKFPYGLGDVIYI